MSDWKDCLWVGQAEGLEGLRRIDAGAHPDKTLQAWMALGFSLTFNSTRITKPVAEIAKVARLKPAEIEQAMERLASYGMLLRDAEGYRMNPWLYFLGEPSALEAATIRVPPFCLSAASTQLARKPPLRQRGRG